MTYRSLGFVVAVVVALSLSWPGVALASSEAVEMTAVLGFFVATVTIVAVVMVGYHRLTVQRHQTLRAMVDKGMTVPPRMLEEAPRAPNPRRDLRWGILLVSAGVGIGLFILLEDGPRDAALGLVPTFIGIGYLIVAKLDWARAPQSPVPEQVEG
jgi:hypothetical protein